MGVSSPLWLQNVEPCRWCRTTVDGSGSADSLESGLAALADFVRFDDFDGFDGVSQGRPAAAAQQM
jgi:hypothetical protein